MKKSIVFWWVYTKRLVTLYHLYRNFASTHFIEESITAPYDRQNHTRVGELLGVGSVCAYQKWRGSAKWLLVSAQPRVWLLLSQGGCGGIHFFLDILKPPYSYRNGYAYIALPKCSLVALKRCPYVEMFRTSEQYRWFSCFSCVTFFCLQNSAPANTLTYHKMGFLTHWGRDKMASVSQTTFSNAFSWMKIFEFRLKFHWSLFLRVQSTIFQHRFR